MNDEVSCSGLGFGCSLIDNFCRCGLGCRRSLIEEVSSGLGCRRSIDVELCCSSLGFGRSLNDEVSCPGLGFGRSLIEEVSSGLGCGCSSIDEVDYCLDNR